MKWRGGGYWGVGGGDEVNAWGLTLKHSQIAEYLDIVTYPMVKNPPRGGKGGRLDPWMGGGRKKTNEKEYNILI